jgi:hypothetical protein
MEFRARLNSSSNWKKLLYLAAIPASSDTLSDLRVYIWISLSAELRAYELVARANPIAAN